MDHVSFFFFSKTCQCTVCSSEKMGHVAPLQTVCGSRGTCSTRLDSIKITPHKNQTKKGPKYKSILIDKIHVFTLMVPLSCPVSFIPKTYTWQKTDPSSFLDYYDYMPYNKRQHYYDFMLLSIDEQRFKERESDLDKIQIKRS